MIEQTLAEEINSRDKVIKYLQEAHKKRGEEILGLQAKIKQRNNQVNHLKVDNERLTKEVEELREAKAITYPETISELILITACRMLKGHFVDNPMKGLQGYDCDSVAKSIEAIKKVCSL